MQSPPPQRSRTCLPPKPFPVGAPRTHLAFGEALKAVIHSKHLVSFRDAHAHSGAHGRIHAGRGRTHVHDAHIAVALQVKGWRWGSPARCTQTPWHCSTPSACTSERLVRGLQAVRSGWAGVGRTHWRGPGQPPRSRDRAGQDAGMARSKGEDGGRVSYLWDFGVWQLDGQPLVGVEVVLEAPGRKGRSRTTG